MQNLEGLKYGKLTFIKFVDIYEKGRDARWLCRCDCGGEKILRASHVKRLKPKSCGKCRYIGYEGKKYNRITLIHFVKKNKYSEQMWLCKCDCGVEKIMKIYNVITGNSKSCGCLTNEKIGQANRLPKGIAAFRRTYQNYKKGAIFRKFVFSLTENEFRDIAEQKCFYCNIEPYHEYKADRNTGTWKANGLDRVDSTKGYTTDNVVPCCWICNDMKKNKPLEEFKQKIKNIYNKLYNA